LNELGWKVIVIWECELKPNNFEIVIKHLFDILQHNLQV